MKIKTIDVNAKEWLDKINGNSYFAGTICLNFGTPKQVDIVMPFQYGYDGQYTTEAMNELIKKKFIKDAELYESGGSESLWRYCDRKKITLRTNKQYNCKQRELKDIN